MKKIIIALSLFLGLVPTAFAVSATPTPAVSKSEQLMNNLKDRIASEVAQKHLVDKRGIIGIVNNVSETQLSLTDLNGDVRLVDVDELTKFSSPSSKSSFGISDIAKGTTIGVIGLYNKESRRLLARWVDVLSLPQVLTGAVLAVNKDDFTFRLATNTNDDITIDVEDITKTLSYDKAGGLVRSGFSKLQVGKRILVIGFPDSKDKKKILASRVTIFTDLPMNPAITLIKPEDIAPVVSTGSGKKLTPITR